MRASLLSAVSWALLAAVAGSSGAQDGGRGAAAPTLTLEAAVREALEASPAVRAAARRHEEAALEEPALLAKLDPRFETSFLYADDRSPRALPVFQGSRSQNERLEAGVVQNTLLGTEARLVLRNDRLVNATPFRPLDPSVDSRLNIELRQPLWRYFWGRPDKARRMRARAGTQAARHAWLFAREETAAAAARGFLEWRHAVGLIAVREEGVADARRLLAKYEEKVRYGLSEESDLLQAKASLEIQETELLLARSRVELARHALLFAMGRPGTDALPSPDSAESPRPAVFDALSEEEAVSGRPEAAEAARRRERSEWDLRVTRLDTLPDLSLSAAYGFAGLDTAPSASWRDLGGWRHPAAAVGAGLSVPFGFKRERLDRRGAELTLEAARAAEEDSLRRARLERRNALESLRLSRARAEAARRLLELQRRKFAAGRYKIADGNFLIHQMLMNTLVNPFVMTANQNDAL